MCTDVFNHVNVKKKRGVHGSVRDKTHDHCVYEIALPGAGPGAAEWLASVIPMAVTVNYM